MNLFIFFALVCASAQQNFSNTSSSPSCSPSASHSPKVSITSLATRTPTASPTMSRSSKNSKTTTASPSFSLSPMVSRSTSSMISWTTTKSSMATSSTTPTPSQTPSSPCLNGLVPILGVPYCKENITSTQGFTMFCLAVGILILFCYSSCFVCNEYGNARVPLECCNPFGLTLWSIWTCGIAFILTIIVWLFANIIVFSITSIRRCLIHQPNLITAIPKKTFEETICPICLEVPPQVTLSCGHQLCSVCLKACIDKNIQSCPTCRAKSINQTQVVIQIT